MELPVAKKLLLWPWVQVIILVLFALIVSPLLGASVGRGRVIETDWLSTASFIPKRISSAVSQCLSAALKIDQISFSNITLTHAKNDKNVSLSSDFFNFFIIKLFSGLSAGEE